MSKKLISLLLAFTMILTFSVGALAEGEAVPVSAPLTQDYSGKIVILHTNDVHGAITGYAKIAALKTELETQGAYVLLMDDGDYIQGTTYVSISEGKTAVELMNLAGYDVSAVGNHEFDYGYENLTSILKDAQYKTVAANVKYNGEAAFDNHVIFTAPNGTKVGVFGLDTPETATKAHPAKIQGVTFAAGDEMFKIAQSEVDTLKAAGCGLIVCLGHLGVDAESTGNRSVDLLAKVTGIDLFIDGHSHSVIDGMSNEYQTYQPGGTMLVSTGTAFANIGMVVYDGETLTSSLIPVTGDMAADTAVKTRSDAIVAEIEAIYGAVFAKTGVELNGAKAPGNRTEETNLGDLITDAMLWKANALGTAVDGALTNGGGIRATIAAGDITMNDIHTVLPFGNTLCLVQVTGAELLEALEASTYSTPTAVGGFPQVAGIAFAVDTTVPYAQGVQYAGSTYYAPARIGRVSIQSVGGKAFDMTATYTIATNDFLAAGGDTYYVFSHSPFIYDLGAPLDEIVVEYITTVLGGTIGSGYAAPAGRITVRTAPEEPTVPVTPPTAPATVTYTVVKGDCLWRIAKKYYGNGVLYTKIVEANKNLIKNPDMISIGWVLTIPQ
ncbi:MAG: 5'-nucleotidase C-terminal domain-containing protein [Clostridiaceae bacterium]|nr:5'-nucleotidase C-terminal domain-containing protein [Clostridiaceae bacterium]